MNDYSHICNIELDQLEISNKYFLYKTLSALPAVYIGKMVKAHKSARAQTGL